MEADTPQESAASMTAAMPRNRARSSSGKEQPGSKVTEQIQEKETPNPSAVEAVSPCIRQSLLSSFASWESATPAQCKHGTLQIGPESLEGCIGCLPDLADLVQKAKSAKSIADQ